MKNSRKKISGATKQYSEAFEVLSSKKLSSYLKKQGYSSLTKLIINDKQKSKK